MKIRVKFKCAIIENQPQFQSKAITLTAVIDGSEENKSFSKYTPSGNLNLQISYETDACNYFVENKEYFLDIEEC